MCCRALLAAHFQLRYLAVPDDGSLNRDNWWTTPRARKIVLAEFPKLLVYRLVLLARGREQGRRDTAILQLLV
jgi:hypothetical protein